MRKRTFTESQLGKLAKKFREQAGKNRADVAREFGVHRGTISRVEDDSGESLTSLRIRIIERYSGYKVEGPIFMLKKA